MAKMNLRGKKFLYKLTQVTTVITFTIGLIILCCWILFNEFKTTHNSNSFIIAIIFTVFFMLISGISDLISMKLKVSIRRDIKAKKAKKWWIY